MLSNILTLGSLDCCLQDEEVTSNTSGTASLGSSRKSSKVSAVTITESESESMEHIYGGSRSRQSRLSVTVDIKLSKGIQQVQCLLMSALLSSVVVVL